MSGLYTNDYPYTDFHELNNSWLIKSMHELKKTMDTFIHNEKITWADPFLWNITTQYSRATIVINNEGDAYISKQPVPAGIQLSNEDYWMEIFNFTTYTRTANQNLTIHVETNTDRATSSYNIDDWLIWNDILYKVTRAINNGDTLIKSPDDNFNLVHFTVEDFCKAWIAQATALINTYKQQIDDSEIAFTNSLQEQFDTAVGAITVDSEVVLARENYYGVTSPTLKQAINSVTKATAYGLFDFDKVTPGINYYSYVGTAHNGGSINGRYITVPSGSTGNLSYIDYLFEDTLLNFENIAGKSARIIAKVHLAGTTFSSINLLILNPHNGTQIPCEFCEIDTNGYVHTVMINFVMPATNPEQIAACIQIISNDGSQGITVAITECKLTIDGDMLPSSYLYIANRTVNCPLNRRIHANEILLTDGYSMNYNTGRPESNSYFKVTDFRPLNNAKYLYMGSGYITVCFYDINKHYIAHEIIPNAHHDLIEIEVPANAFYFRSSISTQYTDAYYIPSDGVNPPVDTITVGTERSNDFFNSIRKAFELAVRFTNSKILIKDGTWDLITEFNDEITSSQATQYGLPVGNGLKVTALAQSLLTGNYTGSDNNVYTNFSPMYRYGSGGYTLDGVSIECSKCRYCLHDDGYINQSHVIRIKNCNFKIDQRNAPNGYYDTCIGGGLAINTNIDVDGCTFETLPNNTSRYYGLTYHNCNLDDAISHVNVHNCYFKKGHIKFSHYGPSSKVSTMIVSNCRCDAWPVNIYEVPGATTPANTTIKYYNIVIGED